MQSCHSENECYPNFMVCLYTHPWCVYIHIHVISYPQPHRVLIPENESRRAVRQSMTFFAHPNHDTLIECIDGSDKYPTITAHEDTLNRLQNSYKYQCVCISHPLFTMLFKTTVELVYSSFQGNVYHICYSVSHESPKVKVAYEHGTISFPGPPLATCHSTVSFPSPLLATCHGTVSFPGALLATCHGTVSFPGPLLATCHGTVSFPCPPLATCKFQYDKVGEQGEYDKLRT